MIANLTLAYMVHSFTLFGAKFQALVPSLMKVFLVRFEKPYVGRIPADRDLDALTLGPVRYLYLKLKQYTKNVDQQFLIFIILFKLDHTINNIF